MCKRCAASFAFHGGSLFKAKSGAVSPTFSLPPPGELLPPSAKTGLENIRINKKPDNAGISFFLVIALIILEGLNRNV